MMERAMRVPLYAFAGVAMLLAVGTAPTGVSAQGVTIEGPGVGVRVGRDRDDWGDRRSERRYYRDRDTSGYSGGGRGCREVTVRERLPDGSTVTRTRTRC
jgi:hypothetical protein